jgi:hypothetical protein
VLLLHARQMASEIGLDVQKRRGIQRLVPVEALTLISTARQDRAS